MKRIRLSTLLLLFVIAALGMALVVQHERASRREAELQSRLATCQRLAEHMQWQRELPITEHLARQIIVEAQGRTE